MKAFTLIEVLVAMAIFILLMTAVFAFLLVGEQSWHTGSGLLDLQQQARLALDGMAREIRQAKVEIEEDKDITIISTDYGSSIEFYMEDVTNSIKYSLEIDPENEDNRQIIRKYGTNTKIIANNIQSIDFCCIEDTTCSSDCSSPDAVKISLRATKEENNRQLFFPSDTGELIEKVGLRNE